MAFLRLTGIVVIMQKTVADIEHTGTVNNIFNTLTYTCILLT